MSHDDELLDFATPVIAAAIVENDDDGDDLYDSGAESVIGMSYNYNNAYYFY